MNPLPCPAQLHTQCTKSCTRHTQDHCTNAQQGGPDPLLVICGPPTRHQGGAAVLAKPKPKTRVWPLRATTQQRRPSTVLQHGPHTASCLGLGLDGCLCTAPAEGHDTHDDGAQCDPARNIPPELVAFRGLLAARAAPRHHACCLRLQTETHTSPSGHAGHLEDVRVLASVSSLLSMTS